MTSEERNLRVKALDILVAAEGPRAESEIAGMLATWFAEVRESAARCCLNVAKDWREEPGDLSPEGKALRRQGAESAELCAYRIAPWTRPKGKTSPDQSMDEKIAKGTEG